MIRFFFLLIPILLWAGCAIQAPTPEQKPDEVTTIWTDLHPENAVGEPITARFSLQVETKERTGRLTGQIWGLTASLMRLDLATGAGNSVAMIRESPDLWAAYLPGENKAYRHARARAGLDLFQIPVPFDAKEISALLVGDFRPILGGAYSSARKIGAGRHHFAFRDGATRFVETNSRRNTLTIRGRDDWLLVCENPYTSPQFPDRRLYRKYTITSARDGKAVLRVKSLEQGTWTATELDLILPSDAQWIEIIPDQK
jgi:hypothetical protein